MTEQRCQQCGFRLLIGEAERYGEPICALCWERTQPYDDTPDDPGDMGEGGWAELAAAAERGGQHG